METLNNETRKANKDHICDWCHYKIKKGEEYNHQTNKYDGKFYIWKSHIRCMEVAHHLDMFNQCDDGVDSDSFRDIIRDEFECQFTLEEQINILYNKIKGEQK